MSTLSNWLNRPLVDDGELADWLEGVPFESAVVVFLFPTPIVSSDAFVRRMMIITRGGSRSMPIKLIGSRQSPPIIFGENNDADN